MGCGEGVLYDELSYNLSIQRHFVVAQGSLAKVIFLVEFWVKPIFGLKMYARILPNLRKGEQSGYF